MVWASSYFLSPRSVSRLLHNPEIQVHNQLREVTVCTYPESSVAGFDLGYQESVSFSPRSVSAEGAGFSVGLCSVQVYHPPISREGHRSSQFCLCGKSSGKAFPHKDK